MFLGTKGDHSNGKVMTSFFTIFLQYSPQTGNTRCLAADQRECAVSEHDPAVPGIASRKAAAASQGTGKPVPGCAFPESRRGTAQLAEASPSSGNRNANLLRMFFKNANELFSTLLYL